MVVLFVEGGLFESSVEIPLQDYSTFGTLIRIGQQKPTIVGYFSNRGISLRRASVDVGGEVSGSFEGVLALAPIETPSEESSRSGPWVHARVGLIRAFSTCGHR